MAWSSQLAARISARSLFRLRRWMDRISLRMGEKRVGDIAAKGLLQLSGSSDPHIDKTGAQSLPTNGTISLFRSPCHPAALDNTRTGRWKSSPR